MPNKTKAYWSKGGIAAGIEAATPQGAARKPLEGKKSDLGSSFLPISGPGSTAE